MSSPGLAERHRANEKAFTRDRKLALPELLKFLLNLRKGANQDELDRCFEVVCEQPLADSVSKSALTQARANLRPAAFAELSGVLMDGAMRSLPLRRWHGFRLLAVDGSSLLLPKAAAVVEAFGQTGEVTPQARCSRLYDVLNRLVAAADIEPLSVGERVLAGEYLPSTLADDLMLYDRGYPAFWLFAAHAVEQRHFCARLPRTCCTEVQVLAAGTARSAVIALAPGDEARRQCQAFGLPTEALRVRLIRVRLKGGEEALLITSRLDEDAYPTRLFKNLYHLRWGIEEVFKLDLFLDFPRGALLQQDESVDALQKKKECDCKGEEESDDESGVYGVSRNCLYIDESNTYERSVDRKRFRNVGVEKLDVLHNEFVLLDEKVELMRHRRLPQEADISAGAATGGRSRAVGWA